ncbi:MAG: hypothetical protein M3Z02_06095, partial [Actinomycetota bacterium]|nr:hypothetical protein [Actinomycetota bacterium]
MRPRRALAVLSLALVAPLLGVTAPLSAAAAGAVSVRAGSSPETTVFPNDAFTVPDAAQISGRRVNLPMPPCDAVNVSPCDAVRIVNVLDGFDLQPRVAIPFSGPIQLDSVNSTTVYVEGPDGRDGLRQIVWDPATNTVAGNTKQFLREDTTYTIVVVGGSVAGVLDDTGHPIAATVRTTFTTQSATSRLRGMQRALDDGTAYTKAGIASRAVDFVTDGKTTVYPEVAARAITRNDQVAASDTAPLKSSPVFNFVAPDTASCFAFGSFESPQFVDPSYDSSGSVIPPVPTRQTPEAKGKARIGFALIVPAGPVPTNGWPVAVYGPGFTRSYFDLLVTSDFNASQGIATIATDPLGHGYGHKSTITVPTPTGSDTFSAYGRGHDVDGDGKITAAEGVQPLGDAPTNTPSPNSLIGTRDGLIQTVIDNMALVRSVQAGITVPNCGLSSVKLAKTNVEYYGLSFGGIYGTMLMGTDPSVKAGLLNVPGGPIIDIARLSGFRDLLATQLGRSRPNLLNGGPGLEGFTESIPLPNDPRVTAPLPGAIPIQQYFALANWAERSGSPETFAPLLRLRTTTETAGKTVAFQTAFGDGTVPNFTAGNIYRAGQLFDRVTYYRNDKTPTNGNNPHGFLADPSLAGRVPGEAQLTAFLKNPSAPLVDPDGPLPIFEVPIADPNNLQCLHYPDPQTGVGAYPPPAAGECAPAPA